MSGKVHYLLNVKFIDLQMFYLTIVQIHLCQHQCQYYSGYACKLVFFKCLEMYTSECS